MSCERPIRVNEGLYKELRRIQDEMRERTGLEISMPEASRIFMSRRYRTSGKLEFNF